MSTSMPDNQPVIILGAARSGTRLLRSLIAATGCYAEVPFDVNYIWRYGNESCPGDALCADQLTLRTRQFVRDQLPRCARQVVRPDMITRRPARKLDLPFVEKTVSNVLRVPFVAAVYPEARFVALVRDGRDVAESAAPCWREPPQARYLLAKLRTFPWRHCAPYAWKYAVAVARRCLRLDSRLRTWGPRYPGIDADIERYSLLEVCARQWVASIEYYENSRHLIPPGQLLELRYEELVGDSNKQIHRICDFLRIEDRREVLRFALQTIRADRVASSRCLTAAESHPALQIMHPVLERWGYVSRAARAA